MKGLSVNVTVENLAPCKKLLRVEVDVQAVDAEFESVTKDFQKQASLPGFRAGKAPRDMVVKAYSSRIEEEVKKKLIPDAYRKALTEQKLRVVAYPDIEEIQFGRGQALQFAATIETEPEFELPEYKGLTVKRETRTVTDEDVVRALDVLRGQRAEYKDVTRPAANGDFAVISYTGTCEGRPITELAPTAKGLTEQKNFWVHLEQGQFIPGFPEQLIGATSGEKRAVTVDFPAEFVAPQLAGKKGSYDVEVVQVKERVLPDVNEEFAKSFGAESLDKLREGVRADLQNELNFKQGREARDQIVTQLLSGVKCDLPESVVLQETRSAVYNIVQQSQKRGATQETINAQKDQIFSVANNSAKERVKAMFLLGRIAEKEGIKSEQPEIIQRVHQMAQQYQLTVEKMVKQLQERGGFEEINEQIVTSKVLDFLVLNAKVEEVAPAATAAPAASAEPAAPPA